MILSSSHLEKFAGCDLQLNVPHINWTSSKHVSGPSYLYGFGSLYQQAKKLRKS
jgi:hypothetical protein